jgi:hypothetical protein
MLKFSKKNSSKSKKIVKENSGYLGISHLLKWMFQNYLIIQQTCVEMAKVLRHWNLQLTDSTSKNKKRTNTDFSGPEPQLESMI